MFHFLFRRQDGDPNDPAVFETTFANWTVGETFLVAPRERLRILAIDTDISDQLVEEGFNGVFTVESGYRVRDLSQEGGGHV